MDYANTNSELYHHGTKGMKWGIRRYQNKDGSLTPLGRKRYGTLDGLANSDYGRKMAKKGKLITNGKSQSTASKKVSEMTDDELRSRIQSMQLQRTYNQLYSELNPPTVSKGKKFAKATFDHVVKPGFNAVGKPLVEKGVKKLSENLFGKDAAEVAKKEFEKLKREADIWEAKGKISKNKRTVDENNEYFNDKSKDQKSKEKTETQEKNASKEKTETQEKNASKEQKIQEKNASKEQKTQEKAVNKDEQSEIIGEGRSKSKIAEQENTKWYKYDSDEITKYINDYADQLVVRNEQKVSTWHKYDSDEIARYVDKYADLLVDDILDN